jgi:hypothetical protein
MHCSMPRFSWHSRRGIAAAHRPLGAAARAPPARSNKHSMLPALPLDQLALADPPASLVQQQQLRAAPRSAPSRFAAAAGSAPGSTQLSPQEKVRRTAAARLIAAGGGGDTAWLPWRRRANARTPRRCAPAQVLQLLEQGCSNYNPGPELPDAVEQLIASGRDAASPASSSMVLGQGVWEVGPCCSGVAATPQLLPGKGAASPPCMLSA